MSTRPPRIGIIGGFSAETSALFCARLVHQSQMQNPLSPPAFVMDSVSVSPDLASQAIHGSREAAATLVGTVNASIRRLKDVGVKHVTLPCNTMHVFADAFELPPSLRLIHIVDTVIDELKQRRIGRIGLLATQLTVDSGLYAERCAAAGIETISLTEAMQRRLSDAIGSFVRDGQSSEETAHTLRAACEEFGCSGIQAIVLGCTDLSGMLRRCELTLPIPCIDSMDSLAMACAKLCA